MPRLVKRQAPLSEQLEAATTPAERALLALRIRHAESGDGLDEGAGALDGLVVNGRDPFAALRKVQREAKDGPDRREWYDHGEQPDAPRTADGVFCACPQCSRDYGHVPAGAAGPGRRAVR